MTTLREFISQQSSLDSGNTVRDSILSPESGGNIVFGLQTITIDYVTSNILIKKNIDNITINRVSESLLPIDEKKVIQSDDSEVLIGITNTIK